MLETLEYKGVWRVLMVDNVVNWYMDRGLSTTVDMECGLV